jgi:pimeloyl-ACP methyl ester carboxylesterase
MARSRVLPASGAWPHRHAAALLVLLTALLLAGGAGSARAADDRLVPLLTGGLLTARGSVTGDYSLNSQTHDWPAKGSWYHRVSTGAVDFETSWLIEGRYADVPSGGPLVPMPTAWQYKAELGGGTLDKTVRTRDGRGKEIVNTGSCAWTVVLSEPPPAAALDASGRSWLVDPLITRDERRGACTPGDGSTDFYTGRPALRDQRYTFPDTPLQATRDVRAIDFTDARPCAIEGEVTLSCANRVDGRGELELSCALCVEEIRYEHHVPSGGVEPVGADGTYDGNRVRITAKVRNATTRAISAPIRFRDMTYGRWLEGEGPTGSLAFAPGATTDVVFEWDSDGYAWLNGPARATLEHAIAALTPYGSAQRQLSVMPKPVVLVHGWNSDASTWASYPGFLRAQSPYWLSMAARTLDTDPEGSRSIFDNAQALANEVKALRQRLDADHVDLVAHSMGGLISRAYIDRAMGRSADGRPWARHLVMLGTPNRGSPCANLVYAVLSGRPTLELMPAYVDGPFNRLVTDRKGVAFSILAGDYAPTTCLLGGSGDLVVELPSALWQIADRMTMEIDHVAMTGSAAVFDRFVRPRLAVGPGAKAATAKTASAARSAARTASAARPTARAAAARATPAPQLLAARRVKLKPRGTAAVAIAADRGSRLSVTLLAGPQVTSRLLAPGGKVVATVRGGSVAARQPLRSLSAPARRGGRFTLRLSGARRVETVAVVAALAGGKLKLSGSATQRKAGAPVAVTARLTAGGRRAVRGATIVATVRGSGRRAVRLTLRRNRDGSYRATTRKGVAGSGAGVVLRAKAPAGERVATVVTRTR